MRVISRVAVRLGFNRSFIVETTRCDRAVSIQYRSVKAIFARKYLLVTAKNLVRPEAFVEYLNAVDAVLGKMRDCIVY